MKENNKKDKKRGGFSNSDPGRKDKDYWKNPTVLKILCAVAVGKDTITKMEKLKFHNNKDQYLPKPTLVKYMTRGNRVAFRTKHSEDRLNNMNYVVQVETPMNMITKEFLIIINKADNAQVRQTKSREEYIYEVNYDLIIDEFIDHINSIIEKTKERVEELVSRLPAHMISQTNIRYPFSEEIQKLLSLPKGNLNSSRKSKSSTIIIPDIHATYELEFYNRLMRYHSIIDPIKLDSEKDKIILKEFLKTFFIQYHQLRIENIHITNLFDNAINHLKRGEINFFSKLDDPKDKWWRINKESAIFKKLNETLRLADVDYFDLAPIVIRNEQNRKDIQ